MVVIESPITALNRPMMPCLLPGHLNQPAALTAEHKHWNLPEVHELLTIRPSNSTIYDTLKESTEKRGFYHLIYLIVVEGFACPMDPRSSVVRA